MTKLIGLSGSLRQKSFNTSLLHAAATLMPADSELSVRTMHGIPLYDGDVEEATGIPAAVSDLKDAIAAADGLIIATPEYNNSIPGVLKNTIDWLSRPPADIKRVFNHKPIAVIGASIGGFGTILSQNALLPVLRHLGTLHWFEGRLLVSKATDLYDSEGQLIDQKTKDQLKTFLEGFTKFANASKS
jgi:NAD(P)H-dependent FMN reductase